MANRFVDATLRLVDKFSSPLSKATAEMQAKGRQIQKTANSIKRTGKNLESVGTSLTKKVTTPIIGIMSASGKMADTFEKDMGQVNTLLDNHNHLKSYKSMAIKTSNETNIALHTISEGVYQMISSIGDSGAKTQKIFNVAAKAAKGGGSSVQESVALISSAMKGYDSVNVKTAQSISDMAFQTQKLGVTTYKELAASMQPLFPLGKSLNVSYQELFGSMATLTGVTGNTAEVTTQMKGLFTGLLKPTDSMGKLMEKYGYANGQAMIKAEGMQGVLKILQKETGGQSNKMAQLFSNSRALTAALALTGSQYETFKEKTAKMGKAQGSTEKALQDMQTSMSKFRKTINVVKNSLTVFGSAVLQVVVPPATKAANKLSELTDRFSKLSPETQKFIVKTAMIVAAVGPAVVIIGKMAKGFSSLYEKGAKVKEAMKGGSALSALLSPGGKIVLILGAIAVAAVLVYKNWNKITGVWKNLKKTWAEGTADINKNWKKFASGTQKAVSSAGKSISSFRKSASKSISNFGKNAMSSLKSFGNYVKGSFSKAVSAGVKRASSGFNRNFLEPVKIISSGTKKVLNGIDTFLTGVFTGNWKKAWTGIKNIYKSIFETFGAIAKRPLNSVIGMMNTVIGGFNKIKIPSWVPKVGGKGINIPKIPALASGTKNWGGGIVQINERGGEIVDLPRGSRVYPHDTSVRMAKNEGKKVYKLEKLADTIIIREEADVDKIMDRLADKFEAVPA
nr:MAG TPA: minor tail protein [Caudoviricetes sp.]